MHKFVKKGLAVALGCAVMLSVAGCVTTEEVDEEGAALTLETLEGWCDYSGTAFLNAYRMRDVDAMDDYIANGMVDSFDDAYDQFFDVQSRKVWLEDFYVNYLEGAQVISGTFLSDGTTVSQEYSIVVADYSTGNRNWLLLYNVTLYFGVDVEEGVADILNPEVVFDLYRDMSNDYTSHVAATLLNVTDDFDISNYYYDEDLGVYIDRRELEVVDESEETEETAEVDETSDVEETEFVDETEETEET